MEEIPLVARVVDRGSVLLSTLARAGTLWIVLAAGSARRRRTPKPLLATAGVAWAAELLSLGLSHVVDRDRPCRTRPSLVECPDTPSFPSSHSASSAAATVLARFEPRFAGPLMAGAGLVAAARVRVGVHHASDVSLDSRSERPSQPPLRD
jgi:membrane-associated phospholipid phosphatase